MTATAHASAARVSQTGWFAHRFDPERDLFHLIPATADQLRAATFLTDDQLGGASSPRAVARAAALAAAGPRTPVHFLFHSAFCCSTLLARALDRPGVALALREPVLFNDLIGWRGRGGASAQVAKALDDAMRLLEQPAAPDEAVLIKPSNLANPLALAALALRPQARAVLLHAPLPTFLASIASKGLEGRLWVRELWFKFLGLGVDPFGFSSEELFRHSDLQVAALGWLAQQRDFAALSHRFGDRVRTLSSEDLMADPARALVAAAAHYGLAFDPSDLAQVAAGPAFARHAKTGEAFDVRARDALHRGAAEANADEIAKVARWAAAVADATGAPLALPRPLLA
jgi:hypothetical protein